MGSKNSELLRLRLNDQAIQTSIWKHYGRFKEEDHIVISDFVPEYIGAYPYSGKDREMVYESVSDALKVIIQAEGKQGDTITIQEYSPCWSDCAGITWGEDFQLIPKPVHELKLQGEQLVAYKNSQLRPLECCC